MHLSTPSTLVPLFSFSPVSSSYSYFAWPRYPVGHAGGGLGQGARPLLLDVFGTQGFGQLPLLHLGQLGSPAQLLRVGHLVVPDDASLHVCKVPLRQQQRPRRYPLHLQLHVQHVQIAFAVVLQEFVDLFGMLATRNRVVGGVVRRVGPEEVEASVGGQQAFGADLLEDLGQRLVGLGSDFGLGQHPVQVDEDPHGDFLG